MTTKMNKEVYEMVSEIRVDVAAIKEHLRALNGKVIEHKETIKELCTENDKRKEEINGITKRLMWYGGALSVVLFFLNLFTPIIRDKIIGGL